MINQGSNNNAIIALYFISLIMIVTILHSEFLWLDEAVQFYISKGININSSDFFNLSGNLNDVILNNTLTNLDPGGFSVILHYWSKVSNNIIWLRILPFSFYIIFVISFCYVFYLLFDKNKLSIFSVFISLFIPQFISKSIELRAYSMEMLGVSISILFLIFLEKKITNKKLLFFSLVMSFFITSRYSFLLTAFIHTLFVIKIILSNKTDFKKQFFHIMIYSIPLIITVISIFFFSLIKQKQLLLENPYLGYTPYLNNNPLVLLEPKNIIYILLIVCITLFYFKRKNKIKTNLRLILEYTIISNLFFVFISFLGLHPWSLFSPPRGNHLLVLSIVSIISIVIYFFRFKIEKVNHYITILFLATICFIYIYFLDITLENNWRNKNVITDLKKFESDEKLRLNKDTYILINKNMRFSVRYAFEYGIFKSGYKLNSQNFVFMKKNKPELYPENYRFLISYKWTKSNYNKLDGYNYIFSRNN